MGSAESAHQVPPSENEHGPIHVMTPFQYNGTEWAQVKTTKEGANHIKESLRIITFNVWFDGFMRQPRAVELFRVCRALDADIICLQEGSQTCVATNLSNQDVTDEFLSCLKETALMQQSTYFISEIKLVHQGGYGVAILSKMQPISLQLHPMQTAMGRSVLIATFMFNNQDFCVATVHLESLASARTRKSQLNDISRLLSAFKHATLMGDFNFDSERHFSELDPSPLEETDSLQALFPDYLDAWRSLKYQSGDLGKTFDTDINEMLKYMRHRHEKMRYDRIMLKSKSHNGTWKLKKVDMLGDKPFVTEKGCPVHISDHFGLCLDITWETPQ